jgi:hypothetical protein
VGHRAERPWARARRRPRRSDDEEPQVIDATVLDVLKDLGLIGSSFIVLGLLVVWWYWIMSRFGSF